MTFGLTPLGFNAKRLADLKQDLENAFIAEFGDINIAPQSVFGQVIGTVAKPFADVWENMQDVYFSQYPNSAEGVALDNVVQYNGLTRAAAQRTVVTVVASGNESTLIPAGSLVRIANTNNVFSNPVSGIITAGNAYQVLVQVQSLGPQVYVILVNNDVYRFSLPILTLVGNYVPGDVITIFMNGRQLPDVFYTIDSANTNAAVAAMFESQPEVAVAGTPDGNHINITPALGYEVVIEGVQILGPTPPFYTLSFDTPASLAQVSLYLAANINNGVHPVTAEDLNGFFTITADDVNTPFAAIPQANLTITARSSPIAFVAQDFGPIPAPANSVTEILSPVGGWDAVTNPREGIMGRFIETDAELRIRRLNSVRLLGNSTVEAIRARILQNVPGVTAALVFENQEMVQDTIDIVFSGPLISGNTVTITLNSRILPTIPYASSSAATMAQLALLLAAQPEIRSASVVGGTSNTLRIDMNIFQEVTINGVAISSNTNNTTWIAKGGRPPKSFEVVVSGGSDANIAEEIWLSKPAGIQTFGNTSFTIIDSQGGSQVIFFSRPAPVYIWAIVNLTLYAEETFPSNGLALVQQAIYEYGQSLGIGADVLVQRVQCQVFDVPGVASGTVQLAATNSPTDAPSYASANIIIEENEISNWALQRIAVTL